MRAYTNPNMKAKFLAGVASVGGPPPSEKVIEAQLETAAHAFKPEGFAFICGRNWAVSARRAEACATKRAVRAAKMAAQIVQKAAEDAAARVELDEIIAQRSGKSPMHMRAVRLALVCKVPVQLWGEHLPVASRDTYYQWKRRGLKAILPYASQTLIAWIAAQPAPR